jgi:hypothetical protein
MRTPVQLRIEMNGELLQAANYLCNKGLTIPQKTCAHSVPITLVTLTLPYLLVTFRLKPFFSGI